MRSIFVALTMALAVAPSLAAQMPGDELPQMSRARNEYLSSAYAGAKQVLADWQEQHRKNDAEKLARLFTDDGLFSPTEGWYVQGRTALVDTMRLRIPRIQNYHATVIDFTASGGLAYNLGRRSYHRLGGAEADVSGTYIMVLYLDGRRWKIRSYVERPAAID